MSQKQKNSVQTAPFSIIYNYRNQNLIKKFSKSRKASQSIGISPKYKKQRKMTINTQQIILPIQQEGKVDKQELQQQQFFDINQYFSFEKQEIIQNINEMKDEALQKNIPFKCEQIQLDFQSPLQWKKHNPQKNIDEQFPFNN